MVEHIGSGSARMQGLMNKERLTPPEFNTEGMFTVILRRSFDFNKWVNKLSEKRIEIKKAKHNNLEIKKTELAKITGLSTTAIDNYIEVLEGIELVEREGTKEGNWIVHYSYS